MSLTPAQMEARSTGLGGSDAAAACGVSRWKSPFQLYLEKRGEAPAFEGNEATKWGHLLEPVVRQEYAERSGRIVRLPAETFRHPKYPFMIAHPDGVTDDRRLYEGKTAGRDYGWGPDGSDEIPEDYLLQVQHYMLVLDLPVADLAVLIGGQDYRQYEIPADRELQEMLVEAEAELWQRIERGDPPPPSSQEDARLLYGHSSIAGNVEAAAEIATACERIKELKAQKKNVEAEIEQRELEIKLALGELDTLTNNGRVLATWKAAKPRESFDTAAFKAEHPDLYPQFVKTGDPSRRLLIK